jgi:hypothetical protein
MGGYVYNLVFIPLMIWSVTMAVVLMGYLLLLKLRENRNAPPAHKSVRLTHRVSTVVCGIGFRSQLTPGWLTPQAKNWTVSVPQTDSHLASLPAAALKAAQKDLPSMLLGNRWQDNLGLFDSAGRG